MSFFLTVFTFSVSTLNVISSGCVDGVQPHNMQEMVQMAKQDGFACQQHPGVMSFTCPNNDGRIMRMILVKDKKECETQPERELQNLRVLMKKDYK